MRSALAACFRKNLVTIAQPLMAQSTRISWTSSGLSTWLNQWARLAARRRPRSSSGSFNWCSRLMTSSCAVTWLRYLQAGAHRPGGAISDAPVAPHQLFGCRQNHHDRVFGNRHASKALMVDHKYAALRGGRDVDIVGAEPGGGYDHEVLACVQHVGGHALRGADPKSARAVKHLLDFICVAAVDDNDISAAFGKHLISVGMIHGSPKDNSRFQHGRVPFSC